MKNEKKFLSIGEMSKITGAGIKALRHYDKIGILKPAHIDPFTGYRYYAFNQTYIIELIRFAVELDIPLKDFSQFVDKHGTLDFSKFVSRGKEVADIKMKTLEQAMKFFSAFEEKMADIQPLEQFFTRTLPQKSFHAIPYKGVFENIDYHEISRLFLDVVFEYENDSDWPEYGLLTEYSGGNIERFVFAEVAGKNSKIIPAGEWLCYQSENSQIEKTSEIFGDYLTETDTFIAIETEVFSGKFNIHKPINELRVIKYYSNST
jgi:DNA-binding transcriptional MerR regulator